MKLRQFSDDFASLFAGNKECYGVHIPEPNPIEGKKAKGKSFTKTEPLADVLYLKHLHGEISLGVVPINKDGYVSYAAIDIDVYPLNPIKYLTMIKMSRLPMFGIRSKSAGLHGYIFFNPPAKAEDVVPIMDEIRALFGLKPDTEIFPKQTTLSQDGSGNWINLPYYKAEETVRYAYSLTGAPIALPEFITMAMAARTSPKALRELLKKAPMADAPPCLQKLFLSGGADHGSYNDYLFNCGVYLKSRFGESFPEHLHNVNNHSIDPMDYITIDKTVIASLNKKAYTYTCQAPFMKSICQRDVCKDRKYGQGGSYVSDFDYGELKRFRGADENDSYYTWEVDGKVFMLEGETGLLSQESFRKQCISKLNKVPNRLKEPVWLEIVNTALANIVEVEDGIGTGMSDKEQWYDSVEEFFSSFKAQRREQIKEGLVFVVNGRMYFKLSALKTFLSNKITLRNVSNAAHARLIREYGIRRGSLRIAGSPYGCVFIVLADQHAKARLISVQEFPERAEQNRKRAIKQKFEKHKKDPVNNAPPEDIEIDFKEEEKF